MRILISFLLGALIFGVAQGTQKDESLPMVTLQLIDKHGFSETISSPDRLALFKHTNFFSSPTVSKSDSIYGRNKEGNSISTVTSYHDNGPA